MLNLTNANCKMADIDENIINKDKHILMCLDGKFEQLKLSYRHELEYIKNNFCGKVYTNLENIIYPRIVYYISVEI